jgi:hypothetical protein
MVAALAKVASSERRGDKWPADDDVHASEVIDCMWSSKNKN